MAVSTYETGASYRLISIENLNDANDLTLKRHQNPTYSLEIQTKEDGNIISLKITFVNDNMSETSKKLDEMNFWAKREFDKKIQDHINNHINIIHPALRMQRDLHSNRTIIQGKYNKGTFSIFWRKEKSSREGMEDIIYKCEGDDIYIPSRIEKVRIMNYFERTYEKNEYNYQVENLGDSASLINTLSTKIVRRWDKKPGTFIDALEDIYDYEYKKTRENVIEERRIILDDYQLIPSDYNDEERERNRQERIDREKKRVICSVNAVDIEFRTKHDHDLLIDIFNERLHKVSPFRYDKYMRFLRYKHVNQYGLAEYLTVQVINNDKVHITLTNCSLYSSMFVRDRFITPNIIKHGKQMDINAYELYDDLARLSCTNFRFPRINEFTKIFFHDESIIKSDDESHLEKLTKNINVFYSKFFDKIYNKDPEKN